MVDGILGILVRLAKFPRGGEGREGLEMLSSVAYFRNTKLFRNSIVICFETTKQFSKLVTVVADDVGG